MRTQQWLFAALSLSGMYLFMACGDGAETPTATIQPVSTLAVASSEATPAVGYELQAKESLLHWKGRPVVGSGHEGTLQLVSGDLAADATGKWVGGYFVIDMTSIRGTDGKREGDKESGLEAHLKDPDFFDVKKYPKAYFTLLKAVPGANDSSFTLTGQLNLKNITQEISFPATVVNTGDLVQARAAFRIDRTRWGVNYQSSNLVGILKDDIIDNFVPITLSLVFKKK
jgi:polyisoprenoid-binding protein YceI